jgi:3-methyladenine DNA glycosylase AlkD
VERITTQILSQPAYRPAMTSPSRPAPSPERLRAQVRRAQAAAADPARAEAMRAYMRSAMPFRGIPSPRNVELCRPVFGGLEFTDAGAWEAAVDHLWERAEFREERYAAMILTALRSARPFQTPEALPLYERMIVTGAWWDYVDEIAVRRVGPILRNHPEVVARRMRRWSRSSDLWKRRTSIICQVGSKGEIDLALLYDAIAPSLASPDFFLRKAIGWALRQHARLDPEEVAGYVAEHRDAMSPLSRREATRRISPRVLERHALRVPRGRSDRSLGRA